MSKEVVSTGLPSKLLRLEKSRTTFLIRRLKLQGNEQKSHVAPIDQCVVLGFTFRRGKLRWSARAFEDFRHRIRELTGQSWGVSMRYSLVGKA